MLVIAIALTAWWLWRKGRPTRWLLTVAAAGGAFWFLTALNANVLLLRTPTASRYQYPGAVFVLLIAAELLRGIRVGTRALVPAAAFSEARLVASDEVDRTAADRQLAAAEESSCSRSQRGPGKALQPQARAKWGTDRRPMRRPPSGRGATPCKRKGCQRPAANN